MAHCFNMDGRAASQTITDRLPSLMAHGVEPLVLSAPTGFHDQRFRHFQVISPAPSGIRFELRYIIAKRIGSPFFRKLFKGLAAVLIFPFYLLEKLVIHLDSQWSWFIAALRRGEKIVEEFEPVLIYSTAGPPSTHLAGYLLHRRSGIPWLVELHDPLISDTERPRWQNYYFKRWLEKLVARHAQAVIFFTEKARASATARHSFRGKTFVVRPGAEPPDLGNVTYRPGRRMHLGHFGSLAEDRNLALIIRALHELIRQKAEWRDQLCLDIYGTELDSVSRQALVDYPLPGVVVEHGRLEYDPVTGKSGRQWVLEAMRQCDLLLLVHGVGENFAEYIPSKMYEYMLMKRPILGLATGGSELEEILLAQGHWVVGPKDLAGVEKALAGFVEQWRHQGLPDLQRQSPFTVQEAVNRLFMIEQQLTTKAGNP